MKTSITELPDSRVRVQAEVSAEEVERRVQESARQLGRQMRIPGFRKGKVPPPVVIRRLGREAVVAEAVEGALGEWLGEALDAAGIVPVGRAENLVGAEPPAEGEPLSFSVEIGVQPRAQLGEYKGLEVGRREPRVEDSVIDEELERLRDRFATLETVERPADKGDHVVIDYLGRVDGEPFKGGEGRDQLLELGSGRLVPGFEEQLIGAAAGEQREVEVTFPEDYPSDLGGKTAQFEVTVTEVKAKRLPELDDDFAVEQGFDTLQELREEIATRLQEIDARTIDREFEDAVLDAAVEQAKIEIPEKLKHARAHELLEDTMHALAHRGISKEAYLRITGKDEETLAHEAEPEAAKALAREALLAAVVDAEGISPSDEDVLEALRPTAEREGTKPEKLLERLRSSGRLDRLRRDLAARQAAELLVREAKPIDVEQAKARKKLWTPGKEPAEKGSGQLWTPGS